MWLARARLLAGVLGGGSWEQARSRVPGTAAPQPAQAEQQRQPAHTTPAPAAGIAPPAPPPAPHLEAARALGQVRVAVHPVQAVHVHRHPGEGGGGRWFVCGARSPRPHAWRPAPHNRPRPCLRNPCSLLRQHTAAATPPPKHPHLLSVWLLLRSQVKPISAAMSMPFLAARVSGRGKQSVSQAGRQACGAWR